LEAELQDRDREVIKLRKSLIQLEEERSAKDTARLHAKTREIAQLQADVLSREASIEEAERRNKLLLTQLQDTREDLLRSESKNRSLVSGMDADLTGIQELQLELERVKAREDKASREHESVVTVLVEVNEEKLKSEASRRSQAEGELDTMRQEMSRIKRLETMFADEESALSDLHRSVDQLRKANDALR